MVAAAGASAGSRASAPPPKPSDLALTAADVGSGAIVFADKRSRLGNMPVLVRTIETVQKGKPFVVVVLASVERNADAAYADFAETRTELGLAGVRKHLANLVAPGFDWGKQLFGGTGALKNLKIEKAVIGRRVGLGETGFWVPMTVVLNIGTLHYDVAMMYADRAFASVTVLGVGRKPVAAATMSSLARAEQKLLAKVFAVANTSLPTIAGAAQQGQTLTADAGVWTGSPSAFAYVWSRCDAAGATCTPIAGATARTYVPTAADSGATLRVDVTGSNKVSSAKASSAVTAAVA